MSRLARRRRRRDERGAALVEFGLVSVLLFTLLFGVAEFGIAYDRYLGVRQGSREGARQGIVGTVGSDTSCGINGSATSASQTTRQLICLTKSRTGLGDDVRVAINVGTYAQGEPLVVCVEYQLQSVTGFFGPFLDDRVVRSAVQMRIEDTLAVALQSTSETSPSGGSITCAAS